MFQAEVKHLGGPNGKGAHGAPAMSSAPPKFLSPQIFPSPSDPFHPQNAQLPTSPRMGKPESEHHCVCLPCAGMPGVNVDYFPLRVTGEEAAGEAAGIVSRNILALALSWRPVGSLCPNGL